MGHGVSAERCDPAIASIILAAGQSRRMGALNKLLLPIDGTAMIRRVVDNVLMSRAQPVVVVTGFEFYRVADALAGCDVRLVHNPLFEHGMGASLACGFRALTTPVDAALVCLGDMPFITAAIIDELLASFSRQTPDSICVPVVDGRFGHPVLFASRYFQQLAALDGDQGARKILDAAGDALTRVIVEDGAVFRDIDREEDL